MPTCTPGPDGSCCLLAKRNIRRARADLRGAKRLAVCLFVGGAGWWVLNATVLPYELEVARLLLALALIPVLLQGVSSPIELLVILTALLLFVVVFVRFGLLALTAYLIADIIFTSVPLAFTGDWRTEYAIVSLLLVTGLLVAAAYTAASTPAAARPATTRRAAA